MLKFRRRSIFMKDFKFLYAIGGIVLLICIFIFLPMFFTYLSSGDVRAPSEIHPSDPLGPKIVKGHEPKNSSKPRDANQGYKTEP